MDRNLKDTELRLGLPGTGGDSDSDAPPSTAASRGSKRANADGDADVEPCESGTAAAPPAKAQLVGWPPIKTHWTKSLHQHGGKKDESKECGMGMYVKVSMDGAPFLRKIDIKGYKGYPDLLKTMEVMFKLTIGDYSEREGYMGSDFVPTYEDKDGDWMLVGDVPWEMFMSSCKRLRIVKGSEAKGLACNM